MDIFHAKLRNKSSSSSQQHKSGTVFTPTCSREIALNGDGYTGASTLWKDELVVYSVVIQHGARAMTEVIEWI